MVYYLFFKALGILLFIVEIIWFIALPCWRELKVWVARRAELPRNYRRRYLLLGMGLLVMLAIPLPDRISAPGVVHSAHEWTAYAPVAARIDLLRPSGRVAQGAELARLEAPELKERAAAIQADIKAYDSRLAGFSNSAWGSRSKPQPAGH